MGLAMRNRLLSSVFAVAVLAGAGSAADTVAAEDAPNRSGPAANLSAPPVIQRAPSIEIVGATYGLRRTRLICPAAAAVRRECQGRLQCSIMVADAVCPPGERPPSVLIATLAVQFPCFPGDRDRTAAATRPFQLSISCAGLSN